MKKSLSLSLAVLLCLSLCACTSNKYLGTYEKEYAYGNGYWADFVQAHEVMDLTWNGKGTFCVKSIHDSEYLSAGTILAEGTVTWNETDGYIVITRSGTLYLRMVQHPPYDGYYYYADGNEAYNKTETYELKGSKLINVTNSGNCWDKIQ